MTAIKLFYTSVFIVFTKVIKTGFVSKMTYTVGSLKGGKDVR